MTKRRPKGLKTEKERRLFDRLADELNVVDAADRELLVSAVKLRTRSDELLDSDRVTASNEAGRRSDKILTQLRQRSVVPQAEQPVQDEWDSLTPRRKYIRSLLRGDVLPCSDPDAQHFEDLCNAAKAKSTTRGGWRLSRAAEAWANGQTKHRPTLAGA